MSYRLWVNEARTVLVRVWDSGTVEVATRPSPVWTWEPPVTLTEERVDSHGGENPSYGPGNPDWERDFDKTLEGA